MCVVEMFVILLLDTWGKSGLSNNLLVFFILLFNSLCVERSMILYEERERHTASKNINERENFRRRSKKKSFMRGIYCGLLWILISERFQHFQLPLTAIKTHIMRRQVFLWRFTGTRNRIRWRQILIKMCVFISIWINKQKKSKIKFYNVKNKYLDLEK